VHLERRKSLSFRNGKAWDRARFEVLENARVGHWVCGLDCMLEEFQIRPHLSVSIAWTLS
jgi:hypothetical protein